MNAGSAREPRKERREVPNRAPWGQVMRYSRAIRVGDTIEVSGTTAVKPEGKIIAHA
jgi:enamine deaminase RidA (YjgF/YER057c/UK114 family)